MIKRTWTPEKKARIKELMAQGYKQHQAESKYMDELMSSFNTEIQKRRDTKAA